MGWYSAELARASFTLVGDQELIQNEGLKISRMGTPCSDAPSSVVSTQRSHFPTAAMYVSTLPRRSNSYHRSLSFVLLCTYRHTLSIWARTMELTFASGVKGLPRSLSLRHLHCLLTAMSSLLARQWARARSVCGPSRQGWNFYMAPRLSHPSSL